MASFRGGAGFAFALLLTFGAPAVAAAQDLDTACSLLSRVGSQFTRTPLPGFDPATAAAPLSVPHAQGATALVLCHRGTIFPEPMDYRVPAEARVPLAITDDRRVLQLDLVDGRLGATFRRGSATPDEEAEVKARVEAMQAAMQGGQPTK